ncbi:MAG: hypothetical protein GWP04_07495 [Gammaproteobacteria bacterium]|nr:hypothetical protein [Gammaproteobacteria bacterium]
MKRLWIVGLVLIAVALVGSAVSFAVPSSWSGTWMHGDTSSGWWNEMGEHRMHDGEDSSGAGAILGATEVAVVASEFRFDPPAITVRSGEAVNLTLVNEGALLHDLTIPALGVRVVVGPGRLSTIGLTNLPGGEYEILCSVPGHAEAGMIGTLEVTG